MATPNSPFGPPAGGRGPASGGASARQPRSLPPPAPASDLDAKIGALLAEGSAGVTDPPEPRRRGAATLILGGALVIGAGLGLGWGIGRATRGSDSGSEVTASPAPSGDSLPDGQPRTGGVVSDAPPSADDTAATTTGAGSPGPSSAQPGTGPQASAAAVTTDSGVANAPPPPVVASTTESTTDVATIATTATQPASSSTGAGPPASAGVLPVGVPGGGLSPTTAATPGSGANLLPTAFAVLEGGRLTVRGTFADQAALDQAITALAPLGTNGLAVEAVVDSAIVGSRQVPVLVSDAAIFQRGSAILGDGAQPVLDLFASTMAAAAASRLIIEGHTDSQGSDAYNFALSQQRIAAVFAYLISKGVDPARLELAPRGETEPVADNATEEGRSRNRRVELIFAT